MHDACFLAAHYQCCEMCLRLLQQIIHATIMHVSIMHVATTSLQHICAYITHERQYRVSWWLRILCALPSANVWHYETMAFVCVTLRATRATRRHGDHQGGFYRLSHSMECFCAVPSVKLCKSLRCVVVANHLDTNGTANINLRPDCAAPRRDASSCFQAMPIFIAKRGISPASQINHVRPATSTLGFSALVAAGRRYLRTTVLYSRSM